MALCTIRYNASTGVAAASGSASPATAHTDVTLSATVSGTTATTVMTFSATINLTGVLDDGTDVIRVTGTAGERHLFRIVTFTGGAATCTGLALAEAIGATSLSASAWAIGGTRGSAAAGTEQDTTRTDIEDAIGGWRYEYGGNAGTDGDYPMAVVRQEVPGVSVTDGPVVIAAAAGKAPQITFAPGNFLYGFTVSGLRVEGMAYKLTSTSGSFSNGDSVRITLIDCVIEAANKFITFTGAFTAINCEFDGTLATVGTPTMIEAAVFGRAYISQCRIHDSAGIAVKLDSFRGGSSIVGNAIWNSGGVGISINAATTDAHRLIQNNTIHNSASHGIELTGVPSAASNQGGSIVVNNVITGSAGFGISATNGGADLTSFVDYNAFGAGTGFVNTSGDMSSNISDQGHNQTLGTGDPYTDSAGNNYTIPSGDANEDAGLGYNG